MGQLKVVRAGAGSGKTFDLCRAIADRVVKGLDPERILATTFTRKAAAELKGRIQDRLLHETSLRPADRLAAAGRLELAVMGTIHSVGHQLLSRYAIQRGLSPRLQILDEAAAGRRLDDLLAQLEPGPWHELGRLTSKLSIRSPQALVLSLLSAKRGNQIEEGDFERQMTDSTERLCQILAPDGMSLLAPGFDQLRAELRRALDQIVGLDDKTKITREAVFRLRRLAAGRQEIWADFAKAASTSAGKRSGADACLAGLREMGAQVRGRSELHHDLRALSRHLITQTLDLGREYQRFKEERGLVDYTDLEVLMLELLEEPSLEESLRSDFDLVMVDEFQDTNPLQLSIFIRLRQIAGESRWVGDPKQAIYGFRGADPALVHAVWDREAEKKRLEYNYRSRRGLVELVGRLFGPVLGDEATLKPRRLDGESGVDRWVLSSKNRWKRRERLDGALAAGVARLKEEGTPLRDVAVLARTNHSARAIGAALQDIGIPCLQALPGLLATRECALALAGLRLVASRDDGLAAATVLHLLGDPDRETPDWLEERLRDLKARSEETRKARSRWSLPWLDDPRLAPLDRIDHRILTPSVVVRQVITALDIEGRLHAWGDAPRRSAHLDALLTLARSYEEEALEPAAAVTLTGLVTYLEELASAKDDVRLPPYGLDAVTVSTYHRAKGLEWPVVVLTGLEFDRVPDLFRPDVSGGEPSTDEPLRGRALRFWPWPFGRQMYGNQTISGTGLKQDALGSREGERASALERAEALRLLYVGFTRARDRLVLAHRKGSCGWLEMLPGVNGLLDPELEPGEHPLEGIEETTFTVRRLANDDADDHRQDAPAEERWLESASPASTPLDDRFQSPSHQPAPEAAAATEVVELCDEDPGAGFEPRSAEADALGNAVHAYLAALPGMSALDRDRREEVARRCLEGFSVGADAIDAPALVASGDRLGAWAARTYPGATWAVEVSVSAPRAAGGQWSGLVDLLLLLPGDEAILIDHKSTVISKAGAEAKAASHAGQLAAYAEALEQQGLSISERWIHFPVSGLMVKVG